jgi:hypothetical protein
MQRRKISVRTVGDSSLFHKAKVFPGVTNILYTSVSQILAIADHLIGDWRTRKIHHTQKSVQVNRRNIISVVKVIITTVFQYADLKHFL